jgi:hypothetical protein
LKKIYKAVVLKGLAASVSRLQKNKRPITGFLRNILQQLFDSAVLPQAFDNVQIRQIPRVGISIGFTVGRQQNSENFVNSGFILRH